MNIYGIITGMIMIVALSWIEVFSKKRTCLYAMFLLFFFSIVIAFRSNSMPDTADYIQLFLDMPSFWEPYEQNIDGYYFETGYTFLVRGIKSVAGNSVRLFFAVITLLNGSIYIYTLYRIKIFQYKSLKIQEWINKIPYCAGICIYFAYYGVWYNAVVIRQGLAMVLLILMAINLIEKKYFRGLLIFFLAVSIHRVAFLGILVAFVVMNLPTFKKNIYYLILIIFPFLGITNIGEIVFTAIEPMFRSLCLKIGMLNRFAYYIDHMEYGQYSKTNFFFFLLGFYLIYYSLDEKLYNKLFNIYILGLGLTFLLQFVQLSYRVTDIFLVFSAPLLFMALASGRRKKWYIQYCVDYMLIIGVFAIILARAFRP